MECIDALIMSCKIWRKIIKLIMTNLSLRGGPMAIIYKYQLKNAILRKQINLAEHAEVISAVVSSNFENNLKDCNVYSDYFEFKLYEKPELKLLSYLTSITSLKLKDILPAMPWPDSRNFFIRMKQKFYVQLEDNESTRRIIMLDYDEVNDESAMLEKASKYFNRHYTSTLKIDSEFAYELDKVKRAAYLDVFYYDIEENVSLKFEPNSWYAVTLQPRSIPSVLKIYAEVDYPYLSLSEKDYADLDNYFYLSKSPHDIINSLAKPKPIHSNLLVDKGIAFSLPDIKHSVALHKARLSASKSATYFYNVYNVGAALATAYYQEGNQATPLLYFDYGCELYSKKGLSYLLPVNEKTLIFLSHNHYDHWAGLYCNIKAYKCHWAVTSQNRSATLTKKLSEIVANSGTVSFIPPLTTITIGNATVFSAEATSKTRTGFKGIHKHETGIGLYIQSSDGNTNILCPGDMSYEFIPNPYVNDLAVLVATHHGGSYRQPKSSCTALTVNEIPKPKTNLSDLVYSCSTLYGHPSFTKEYTSQGWSIEHHTLTMGNFTKKV